MFTYPLDRTCGDVPHTGHRHATEPGDGGMNARVPKIAAAVGLLLLLGAGYMILSRTGLLSAMMEEGGLGSRIEALGLWGPVAVIGLMTAAIVFSPAPSAPIALAAGAAYGHLWGTVYILIGAQLGAMIAFGIARLLGQEAIARWLGRRLSLGRLGSQNTMMAVVFVSRLIPFISFDVVSYAAGLTPLTTWRFAVATLAGIVPASFALAHFGGEMATGEAGRIAISVLLLGALTLIPFAIRVLLAQRRARSFDDPLLERQTPQSRPDDIDGGA